MKIAPRTGYAASPHLFLKAVTRGIALENTRNARIAGYIRESYRYSRAIRARDMEMDVWQEASAHITAGGDTLAASNMITYRR